MSRKCIHKKMAPVKFSLIITSFLIGTIPILKNPREGLVPYGAKLLWGVALIYDFYTSFKGNTTFILTDFDHTQIQQILIAIGLTLFVSSSPIAISHYVYDVESI